MTNLTIRNLSVAYRLQRQGVFILAVDQLNLTVAAGEFVTIVGPSGCGKSTLLHAVAGLLPDINGEIRLADRPIGGPGRERAMVFQAPSLLPWRTVRSNVAYGLELHGFTPREAQRRAQPWIELVGLERFAESYPRELSGGMQQRVNLARALAVQPELLLFDEPLSALDAQTREVMQVELQRIWLETRCSALYVTHQIDEAIFLADKVVVMSARPGRIEEVIPVNFPRPRALTLKRQPTFAALTEQIWQRLQLDTGLQHLAQPKECVYAA
ncbi:MAG: ABC transporter ATP-binding protein [Caldilineaceae bacterium]